MATWIAHGDSSGVTHVNSIFVESLVVMPMTPVGMHTVRIRMISGAEYYCYFYDEEGRDAFVTGWAGDQVRRLDMEPVREPEMEERTELELDGDV